MEDYVTHDEVEDYDGVLLLPDCFFVRADGCSCPVRVILGDAWAAACAALEPGTQGSQMGWSAAHTQRPTCSQHAHAHSLHTHCTHLPTPLAETVQDDGLPRSRGPRVQRSGLGDRLAAKGYSFEIMVSWRAALRCAVQLCSAALRCTAVPCCAALWCGLLC